MKTICKIGIFANLFLFAASKANAGSFSAEPFDDSSYNYLLIIFLILDVLFGFFLIFGKFIRIKKKDNSFTYLESQQL